MPAQILANEGGETGKADAGTGLGAKGKLTFCPPLLSFAGFPIRVGRAGFGWVWG